MSKRARVRGALLAALSFVSVPAAAQVSIDGDMARLAAASPVALAARGEVAQAIEQLHDPLARRQTRAALFDPDDCILSRVDLGVAQQERIVRTLLQHGWIDAAIPLALARSGLFPPLIDDGGTCPHLGFPVLAAPGGNTGSHHSWPGGLAVHIAVNLRSAAALMDGYAALEQARPDRDRANGAILWHDWAKAMVLRWRSDGTTTNELAVAGTGAHHVLGLAEAMRRGLPPEQVIAQACAHGPATAETRSRVQGWLDAAAIVARVDGAAYRAAPTEACFVTHLADQNWVYSDEAIVRAEAWLTATPPTRDIDPVTDPARFRLCVLIPVVAWLGAERLFGALQNPDQASAAVSDALVASAPYAPCPDRLATGRPQRR